MKMHRHGKCGASMRGPIDQVMKVRSSWKWSSLPRSEVLMSGASCWLRSFHQQTKSFTEAEEDLIIKLHSLLGNRAEISKPHILAKAYTVHALFEFSRLNFADTKYLRGTTPQGPQLWGLIAGRLPDRTENEVKTYWNSKLKAKLFKKGNMQTTKEKISLSITRTLDQSQITDAASDIEDDSKVTRGLNLDLSMSLSSSSLLDVKEKVQANTVDHSSSVDAGNIGRKTLLLFQ